MPRRAANLLVLFAAFLWGLSFYFQKEAMSHIGPLLFTGLRGAIAAVALLPLSGGNTGKPGARTAPSRASEFWGASCS